MPSLCAYMLKCQIHGSMTLAASREVHAVHDYTVHVHALLDFIIPLNLTVFEYSVVLFSASYTLYTLYLTFKLPYTSVPPVPSHLIQNYGYRWQ